ncbi:siderophore-iron reductase FhuF [Neobacillus kokaensis]|uniref:Siderophore-iron reductase FhuF n=1 Tax=Neobacillus kokaensis TaxID=2759023 RepID=A0ABQ3N1T5_9BACI|nr:siderophore-iron reductase FhuF [Neobacillus kokaensis]GHH97612.1 hypothetical protein AM1BK_11550 [Neobacillus kokaensis]
MVEVLTQFELDVLQKYRLVRIEKNAFCVADLLDGSFLNKFITELSHSIGAPSDKTAASIFIKRYAFIAVISLYAMTVWNKEIDISVENIKMESAAKGKEWLPSFSLKDTTVQKWNGSNRSNWRRAVVQNLFSNNLSPIIDILGKTCNISKLILWENIAVYLFWLYKTELRDSKIENAAADFNYIMCEASSIFGSFQGNPLIKFIGEHEDAIVRTRKTCCFSYQLPAGKRCKTCPCMQIGKEGRCQDEEGICSAARRFA